MMASSYHLPGKFRRRVDTGKNLFVFPDVRVCDGKLLPVPREFCFRTSEFPSQMDISTH
jgi:hypothetical protein